MCPLCNKHTKSTHHLLLSCEMTQKVWDTCDKWLGILSVRHYSVINHFRSFYKVGCSKKANVV